MTLEEKAAAFDLLAVALTNHWQSGHWTWWCCSPCGGTKRCATREEAVSDLVEWAAYIAKLKGKKAMSKKAESTETKSRYGAGGFSPRFVITRADGKPCRADARYMVLDGSGADPHAFLALKVYAASVRAENPELADDLDKMLGSGGKSIFEKGEWPPEAAQHKDAK